MEVESRHFSSLDSTNNWAKLHLEEFNQDKITIITADGQTSGRGQFNRKWVSPSGKNIYVTFCFFMDADRSDLGNIPQVLAISTIQALASFGFHAKIKWPNDLILSGKKVGGILCETSPVENKRGIVLGIGLNVNMESELLDKIDQPATSLAHEKGEMVDLKTVLDALRDHFIKDVEVFLKKGFSPFQDLLDQFLLKHG